ncbi:MAG: glycolate oxidase subunit GlcF [Alphaproteobacteria bacterium]|nr:glycolate oxidase subunit GlcF [Alphaproteobacteria bacterium]
MQTHFSLAQLADPDIAEANKILRACVHCGFCNATCPTYVLLGDELDGPRGRIYLIKDMLENERPANKEIATHIDRCLSCLACMTTCPSGVHYMHLIDEGRPWVEATYRRPVFERVLRDFLGYVMPRVGVFRHLMRAARLAKPILAAMPGRLGVIGKLMPDKLPAPGATERPRVFPAAGPRRKRVALLAGCVQQVLDPAINDATVRLLTRHGCEVVVAAGAGCCGALTHHLGREARDYVRANVDAWTREIEAGGLDAIIVNASGCGTMVKDYGFLLREDPAYAAKAAKISALTKDVSEFVATLTLMPNSAAAAGRRIAYHSACSLQHGQRVHAQPRALLAKAGFTVLDPPEGHLCCGSAGTYNLLQPAIAGRLRERKVANIESVKPEIIAAGNIGCIAQIAAGTAIPVVHTVELLDWATGGPKPTAIA